VWGACGVAQLLCPPPKPAGAFPRHDRQPFITGDHDIQLPIACDVRDTERPRSYNALYSLINEADRRGRTEFARPVIRQQEESERPVPQKDQVRFAVASEITRANRFRG